jgi:hypothetical protein
MKKLSQKGSEGRKDQIEAMVLGPSFKLGGQENICVEPKDTITLCLFTVLFDWFYQLRETVYFSATQITRCD